MTSSIPEDTARRRGYSSRVVGIPEVSRRNFRNAGNSPPTQESAFQWVENISTSDMAMMPKSDKCLRDRFTKAGFSDLSANRHRNSHERVIWPETVNHIDVRIRPSTLSTCCRLVSSV